MSGLSNSQAHWAEVGLLTCILAALIAILMVVFAATPTAPPVHHKHQVCWDIKDNYGPMAMVNCRTNPSEFTIETR